MSPSPAPGSASARALSEVHAEGFAELRAVLELHQDFALLPVRCPGRHVAGALASYLESQGWQIHFRLPRRTGWQALPEDLLSNIAAAPLPPELPPHRAVIVFAAALDTPGLLDTMNRFRDPLAAHLRCPLLWCGPESFLAECMIGMPDLWSVRTLSFDLSGHPSKSAKSNDSAPWVRFPKPNATDSPATLRELWRLALGQGDWRSAARLGHRLAETLASGGNFAEAREVMAEVLAEVPGEAIAARDALLAARLALRDSDVAEAERLLHGTIVMEGASEPSERAEALAVTGIWHALRGRPEKCEEAFAEALRLRAVGSDLGATAATWAALGTVRLRLGRPEPARLALNEAASLLESLGDARALAALLREIGEAEVALGRAWAAERALRRALELYRNLGDDAAAEQVARGLAELGVRDDRVEPRDWKEALHDLDREPETAAGPTQLGRLRAILARLYASRDEARRVVSESGIDTARIDFSGPAATFWFRILEEAAKLDRIEALLGQVREEYPGALEATAEPAPRRPIRRPRTATTGGATDVNAFDVFLSHNSRDKPAVRRLAEALRERGLRVWLDEDELVPGRPWQKALEDLIGTVPCAAVLIGQDGLGPWEEPEMYACLSEFVDRKLPVIPVLLPGAGDKPVLPLFLRGFTWVDLRAGLTDEGLDRLEFGIRGTRPGTKPGTRPASDPTSDVALRTKKPLSKPRTPAVALLAVSSEPGASAAATAVAERLRGTLAVAPRGPLDAADPASTSALDGADLTIVLLGGATGGTDVLERALAMRTPKPVVLRLQTPDTDAIDIDEWRVAKALRARATEAGAAVFTTPAEAAEHALEAVLAWMREHAESAPGESPVIEPWERSYLRFRLPQWERGRHGPLLAKSQGQRLDRALLYVPLRATTDLVWEDATGQAVVVPRAATGAPATGDMDMDIEARRRGPGAGRDERKPVHLERALCLPALPHLVIEGEAGAGKSVLLQHTAMVLAALHTGDKPPEHALDVAALTGKRPLPPVPILILARALTEADDIAALLQALGRELAAADGGEVPPAAVCAGLEAGRYLLLIDSLDEVPGEEARLRVVQLLEGYARSHPQASRFVLTTRPSPYLGRVSFAGALRTVRIAALGEVEVAAMVRRWCAANACDDSYRRRLGAVIAELTTRPGGANLAENPLLLTCTLLVYAQQERLPDSTAVLYQRIVDILCELRREGMTPEARRQMLESVCLELQRAGGTELPLEAAARHLQAERPGSFSGVEAARDALDRLADDTGLLRFRRERGSEGPVLVQPWHRSFQEYLAACRLAASEDSVAVATARLLESEGDRRPAIEDPAWEGVLRFLVGVYGERGVARAHAYLERLHLSVDGSPRPGRLYGVIASGLAEYADLFDPKYSLREQLPGEIVAAFRRDGAGWPLADRLLALDGLGRLGDPRLAEDPWVDVAADSFRMGGDAEAYASAPGHLVHLSGFRIAWRPVTVADFVDFANHGYNDPAWWSAGRHDGDGDAPGEWTRQLRHPNRPITGVSWYAASAFCRWATETGATPWAVRDGWKVDLPTEAEWEYAARGKGGHIYPWGSNEEPGTGDAARANYSFDGSPDQPTPVGAFPAGNRGRLVDLAGNVWEWCRDTWRDEGDASWQEETDPCHLDGGSPRVIRGGSWNNNPRNLRTACRNRNEPENRNQNVGFRVVCRRFPEHVDH